ncbi:aromatic ring-hydroxylating dioxygenase subunit alpha [Pelomonas sp. KK5]|uniref:aromatic ring-hydroxylating oxygenase subunit alpha n=1 Tax=Pelomonas sp. KK5 TaxID=1855730 RepID=UPI00097CBF00|nr:aromatic ring-hydroxylating dioxygenase subunit alpha [Pelomonas sp. KK5]
MNTTTPEAPPAEAIKQPTVQTLDSLSPDLIAAIRRIPGHDQARAPQPLRVRRPASIFTDPAHFAREQRAIFRRHAVPVGVSAQLPEPNMVQAVKAYGLPLLLTRNATGELKVFLNACQHKGSMLVERCDAHKAGRFSCPYHAWTYSVDGKLVGVPRQESFADLDKAQHGLARLPAEEKGGLIWAMLDRHATPDFSKLDALVEDWESLNLPRLHLYGHKTFELDANWKLVIEPFLEGYHVQRLHAATVGPLFADVPTVSSVLGGDHVRQVSGKADFEPAQLDVPGASVHKTITITYLAFPNVSVITSPYYVSVMLIQPAAADRSVVQYYMLTRDRADNDKARELFARSYEMVLNVFGNEDFRAACISQAGLASGALDEMTYGGLEAQIPVFYEILERHLDSP